MPSSTTSNPARQTSTQDPQGEPINWFLLILKAGLVGALVPLVADAGVVAGFVLGAILMSVLKTIGTLLRR